MASTEPATTSPTIIDDKSPHCIPFILSLLSSPQNPPNKPLLIGLNGLQGSGKTTLVTTLQQTLTTEHNLPTLVLSIDDLYLTHADQVALTSANHDNALVQHRGEPGTHDVALLKEVLDKLLAGKEVKIPRYDKSLFKGEGDRLPESTWHTVNTPSTPPIRIIILEGWCIGFTSLPSPTILTLRSQPSKTLSRHSESSLLFINSKLSEYNAVLSGEVWDAFIHVDALDLSYVYAWRQEQEAALRRERGVEGAMTEEQVERFVDGYFPAYELYTEGVRRGVFEGVSGKKGRQLRLVVGRDRRVGEVVRI